MLPSGPDKALQDGQRSRTGRDQVIGRQMRLEQQAKGTSQQNQPPNDMHDLTQEACHPAQGGPSQRQVPLRPRPGAGRTLTA
jgi:hypothetical protein